MASRIRNQIRSNVIGFLALLLVLSTGSALALNGSDTVFSDDIVNGEVKAPDLGANAVNTTAALALFASCWAPREREATG